MNTLRPGQAIAVRVGPIIHPGIVSWYVDSSGNLLIYSNSFCSGQVALEPLSVFKGSYDFVPVSAPSNLPAVEVLARAHRMLGIPWKLFTWNCEHFFYSAYGLPAQSPQLQALVTVLGLGAIVAAAARA